MAKSWFTRVQSAPEARKKLYCVHYAGGNQFAFKGFKSLFGPDVEVTSIQLPGRLSRYKEQPYSRVEPLIEDLAPELIKDINGAEFALYGHGMGALIVFELERRLESIHSLTAGALFIGSLKAPGVPEVKKFPGRRKHTAMLNNDDEILEDVNLLGDAIPADIVNNKEIYEIFMSSYRADLQLCRMYEFKPGPKLNCPIIGLVGTNDVYDPEHLEPFSNFTSKHVAIVTITGKHLFIATKVGCEQAVVAIKKHWVDVVV
jgi:medium-chain acyl-[acyl-carrier-protein] hydrolase